MSMERRTFIKNCAMLCAGATVIAALADGCTPVYYATAQLEGDKLRLKKTDFTDEKGKARSFVLIRNEKLAFPVCVYHLGNGVYVALSTQCTHSGCEVQPNKTSLVCPCHGSEFSNQGKVLNPPAETDLKKYNVSADNENIFIQI